MIGYLKKELCTGCSACAQSCPKRCIVMTEDEEGFLYPQVLPETCIHCNMCKSVCPVINTTDNEYKYMESYAAFVKDKEIRLKSSSGGIFTLLAEFIIGQNGVVFGAAFDKNLMVHHIGVETIEELEMLRGSKYLQSKIGDAYIEVKRALEKDKYVLFVGTACQVAGLKAYLKKEYARLLAVDILCHGVPSPKVWARYIEAQEETYGTKIKNVIFRKKTYGWKKYCVAIEFSNSKMRENVYFQDDFMKLFLSNICLRPSCYNCQFKKLERVSDFTIGDAWGIDKYIPNLDDDRGTSIIVVQSYKGKKLMEKIKNKMVYQQCEIDCLLPSSSDSRKSVTMHFNRKKFFRRLDKGAKMKDLIACMHLSYYDRVKYKIKKIIFKL